MPAVPGGRIGLQKRAHAKLDGGRKPASEPVVNPADERYRIADQIFIVDIEKCVRAQALSGIEKFLQRILPVLRHFASNRSRINRVAEDTAKYRRQTGCGWEDFQRFPMRLHHERVRVRLEKGVHVKKVGRSLEHETSSRPSVLQMLEKLSVEFVGGIHVLSQQPGLVCGNVVHRADLIAHEGVAHNHDAFLREGRGHWMNLAKFRGQQIEAS